MENLNTKIRNLGNAIRDVRSSSIGIVKFMNGLNGFLLNDSTEHLFHIITLTNAGGVFDEHTGMTGFISEICKIPENFQNLQDLIDSPFDYNNWRTETTFKKKINKL